MEGSAKPNHEDTFIGPDDLYNRTLRRHTHPSDWTNPTPSGRYNLVIVGGGPAGLAAASGAATYGAKVALIERRLLGGDCLNLGCVPSKTLCRGGRAVSEVRHSAGFGVRMTDKPEVDFTLAMERMRRIRAEIAPLDSAERLREMGVDVYLGTGRFTGADTVEVRGTTLRFAKALIATGGRPATPPIVGLHDTGYLTSESVFSLAKLPNRLAVVGGGPIGCELAQAFARFGSEVTLIEAGHGVLSREDRDAASRVQRSLERDGIRIITGTRVRGAERVDGGRQLHLDGETDEKELIVDEILIGVGRQPSVEQLDLERAGVEYDRRRGVTVDDHLRTTNKRIFAAGDVCTRFQFAPTAEFMSRIVLNNALFSGRSRVSSLRIPWATYTSPELAHVGVYEHDALEQGLRIQTFMQEFGEVDRALIDGEPDGFVKIVTKAGSDRILGATIVAEHAGEMIGEIAVAMAAGVGLGRLASIIHPYPTQIEAIRKLGDAYNRTRLTPFRKWLLAHWLKWRR